MMTDHYGAIELRIDREDGSTRRETFIVLLCSPQILNKLALNPGCETPPELWQGSEICLKNALEDSDFLSKYRPIVKSNLEMINDVRGTDIFSYLKSSRLI